MERAERQRHERRQAREVVARIVMCAAHAVVPSGQPSIAEMNIARKNALGWEFIRHYPAAIELHEQEQRRAEEFQRVMCETSKLLLVHGIEHIYIKFRKLYRYYDSNVDVVVRPEHWTQTIALLRDQGYVAHVMFKEPDKIMFDKPGTVSVHLHPGVTWNGVPYFDTNALWRDSAPSPDGPWLELSPEHDFLVNLAHNMFENYEVTLGDVLFFKRFMERQALDRVQLETIAAENGWRYGFQQAYHQIETLVTAWKEAQRSGAIPSHLLHYPYRLRIPVLARAFGQRIASNVAHKRLRMALREAYAYPAFYLLKRRHDLPGPARQP